MCYGREEEVKRGCCGERWNSLSYERRCAIVPLGYDAVDGASSFGVVDKLQLGRILR